MCVLLLLLLLLLGYVLRNRTTPTFRMWYSTKSEYDMATRLSIIAHLLYLIF